VLDLKLDFSLEDTIVKAVDGVSFYIDRGETLAVVGESGSGKFVTTMGLMCLNDYAGGRIISGSARMR
jgi:ABC-type dipeptide/oligopeptide/nickel transport system ATPase component